MSCLLALCLSLGITANSYDDLEPTYSYRFTAGNEIYGWASYEDQTTRMLGQGVSDVGIYAFGVGTQKRFGDVYIFGEVGYAILDDETVEVIANEIVYTVLVNNHGVRTIPFGDPERVDTSHTLYELDNGYMGRIGVGWQKNNFKVSLAYRFLSVDEHYEAWDDQVVATTGGWWQESISRDLSAFEMGVAYEF